MRGHPVLQSRFLILIHGVGGHGNDGQVPDIRPGHRPDRPGRLVAVHNRHLYVHQDRVIVALLGCLHHLYRIRAVRGRLHDKPCLLQNLFRNLAVQFVILHKQDSLSAEISLEPCRFFLFLLNQAVCHKEYGLQIRHKERFCAERGNPGCLGLLLNIRPVIGSQNDDRSLISDCAANPSRCFDTAGLWHLPVYDISMVGIPFVKRALRPVGRFSSRRRPFRAHTDLLEHLAHAGACVEVIVYNQCTQAGQLFDHFRFFFRVLQLQAEFNRKCASLAFFAFHTDLAAHHIYDIFRDGHAQPGSLDTGLGGT